LGDILTITLYEQLFPGHLSFYSYDTLIQASKLFPQFGTTGNNTTRKREIAAFAAHVTQETSGLQEIVEQTNDTYCDSTQTQFPCNGKQFNGRGPLQLSWNYNYGTCGNYLNMTLLGNPDLVATDSLVSFEASLWFWNEYGDDVIPHIHDVITGNWNATNADVAANRLPGFGVTIDIINGDLECDQQSNEADNRVSYFKNFCTQLNISTGDNVDCKNMKPFYS
jgi:chitinase